MPQCQKPFSLVSILGTIACALVMTSCANKPSKKATVEIFGKTWVAQNLDGQDTLEGARPTLELVSGFRVVGFSGCNRFFGSYVLNGGEIEFGPVGSTRMACPVQVMNQEQQFFQALDATESFFIEAESAWLYFRNSAGKNILSFSPRKPTNSPPRAPE